MNEITCPVCGSQNAGPMLNSPAMTSLPDVAWEWVETEGRFVCPSCGKGFRERVRYHFGSGTVEKVGPETGW